MNKMKYMALAAATCFAVSSASATLVLHYTLDDDGSGGVSTVNSGSAAHTWNGTANATLTTGKFGDAGAFTAAASDWWSNASVGADLSSFTLSLHIKQGATAMAAWQDFVSIGDENASSFKFEYNGAHNGTSVYTDGTPGGGSVTIAGAGGPAVNDGAWHHLALVSNGSTLEMFVDGSTQGSAAYTGSGTITAFQLAGAFGAGRKQNVDIDDVAVYDTALNAAQITWLGSNAATNAIPEPATLGILAAFGGGLLCIRRKLMM